jgi:hypothetical protein
MSGDKKAMDDFTQKALAGDKGTFLQALGQGKGVGEALKLQGTADWEGVKGAATWVKEKGPEWAADEVKAGTSWAKNELSAGADSAKSMVSAGLHNAADTVSSGWHSLTNAF